MIYPDFYNYFREIIINKCKESGHVCCFWPDEKIIDDLITLDDKDKGSRVDNYLNRCHEPVIHFTPHDNKCWISFRPLHDFTKNCEYKNQKVLDEIIGKYINENP